MAEIQKYLEGFIKKVYKIKRYSYLLILGKHKKR
jgi:hypothetical protein